MVAEKTQMIDAKSLRSDFPILQRTMNDKPLVYLDNAATTQKPLRVIDRIHEFYREEYATVHRGIYTLSQDSTVECEEVRERCRSFLNAKSKDEIIFVRGATEAINLVMQTYGDLITNENDEILISEVEHHANIVPWQELCKRKGLKLRAVKVNDDGELDLDDLKTKMNQKTRLVAMTHVSNVLGTINPVKEIVTLAHEKGAKVLIDGAQGAPHLRVDVQDLGCDFYCFSGHKIYGPTGIGVLYGKSDLLMQMPPYQFGGDMIEAVTLERTEFALPPARFEAGTPPFVQIVGLGSALAYIEQIGLDKIEAYETMLLQYATEGLRELKSVSVIGTAKHKASLISFTVDRVHPMDLGTILDQEGIAIRAGHHCSQPTMKRFGVSSTARASFAFYNTVDEIQIFIDTLKRAVKVLT